ncbi:MAG: Streptothricin hydrolase [Firmicutes bacterium ADurb.Bin506]|nr:MAG: Streptothricin hydrolase [Firmicutes bacterium ADurb.Bin506]
MNPTTALLVIDIQRGLFSKPTPVYQEQRLLDIINDLVSRAHAARAQVVIVQHENDSFLAPASDGWQLHPSLKPGEHYLSVRKHHASAFNGTDLKAELAARGVTRVVIVGVVTQGCVKATCQDAIKLGYETVLVKDGHSSYAKDAAQLIETWNQRLASEGANVKPAAEIEF